MSGWREVLQHSSAVQQLQQGCARLGLHGDVALELVAFLDLRRRFVPSVTGEEPQNLSPGTQLDQLWHWMLLNTRVAQAVYDLIGGEVDHASTDEDDLSDDTKVVRRLAALNLLATQGWSPTLGFWEEPGTMLHSLRHIKYGPLRVPLYVHEGAGDELCDTLEQLVGQADSPFLAPPPLGPLAPAAAAHDLHAQATADLARSRNERKELWTPSEVTLVFQLRAEQQQGLPRLQGLLLPTVTVYPRPESTVGDLYRRAAKYLSLSQDPTQAQLEAAVGQLRLVHGHTHYGDPGSSLLEAGLLKGHVVHVLQPGQGLPRGFNITVKLLTGKAPVLLVHSQMRVLELKQLLAASEGKPPCEQQLLHRGEALTDVCTLGQYDMQEGAVLHMVLMLRGC